MCAASAATHLSSLSRAHTPPSNTAQSFGWTALHWAADRGLLEVANLLLDYEADVNVRDLNEATPLICAARTNSLATARALLARGARVELEDEWKDNAISIAQHHHHTKMAKQLKDYTKGPLDRLKGTKVVFSYPPSMQQQLKRLVEAARQMKGGEGIYGPHGSELRLAEDLLHDDENDPGSPKKGRKGVPSSPSPTKVTWSGPGSSAHEVTWINACVRATLAVQVAPESDEYLADPVCQEQAMLLNARVKMETLRNELRHSEMDALLHDEEHDKKEPNNADEETPVTRLREFIEELEKTCENLKKKMRAADNRFLSERDTLRRLDLEGPEGQSYRDERKEMLNGLIGEVADLEEEVKPAVEQMHRLLENKRHVLLQEQISNIETTVKKLKSKIRPRPKEPQRDASSKEQDQYKAEDAKIVADNKKLNEDIDRNEFAMERLKAKLKDDLRTLEKPHPPPAFLMTLSAKAFARMVSNSPAFILWRSVFIIMSVSRLR